MKPVRIGCSGWNYEDWRGTFYPQDEPRRRWLELYAERFDTVEVNNTFYRLPKRETVAGWAESVPDDFLFAIKASRYLTHIKRLKDLADGFARLGERIEPLAESGRLGPVLWQLPASFQRDDERLADALGALDSGRHALELRHASWFCADVYALLREHGVALVIADHPDRGFQTHELTANWTYVRLHYGQRGRDGRYSDAEVDTWRRRIAAWRSRVEVLVYFNNDWEAFAPANAERLRDALSRG